MSTSRDQQIRAVLRAALERPSSERASFIEELCGGDRSLQQSVEKLLEETNATGVAARIANADDAPWELPLGSMLAHYRVDGILGRGGMGIVYRATDTKLSRPVAIKLLSATTVGADAERRFRQEAATASGLNHPHIVTVYDVGEHAGRQYIVSELVDGGTLEDWSTSAPRHGWRQRIELLAGVADALAAAHAAGVLHRDIKPGNILIAKQGYAKLADFGLAKLASSETRAGGTSSPATRAGWIVGTVAYMSPEQASAQSLDARSDVFSFGIVLYELLAGRRPFDGSGDLAVLKAIAESPPAPLPSAVPEPLRNLVERALEKDPADRYQTMQDLVADLRRVARKAASHPTAPASSAYRSSRAATWWAASIAVASLTAASWAFLGLQSPDIAGTPTLHLTLPAPGYVQGALAISPDGETVAYASAGDDGIRRVWLAPVGTGGAPRLVPGTEGAFGVFWAPDGESLGFLAQSKLKTVELTAGTAEVLANAYTLLIAGAWLPDNTIVYTAPPPTRDADVPAPLGRIPADGGATELLAGEGTSGNFFFALPRPLPDGEHLLFARIESAGASPSEVYVVPFEGDADPRLVTTITAVNPLRSGQFGNFTYADGFLLSFRGATLVAQRFDEDRLVLSGDVIPLAENVGEFSVSENGVLVWSERVGRLAVARQPRRLSWYDRSGQRTSRVDAPLTFTAAVLGPDEQRIAMSVPRPDVDYAAGIVVADYRGGTTRLTLDNANEESAVWSPDGARLAFTSGRDAMLTSPSRIYERAATGTGAERLLVAAANEELLTPWDWTQDRRYVLFGRTSFATRTALMDIWVAPLSGDAPYPLIESPFLKSGARVSPDGRWIAYATNESGQHEVVIQGFPDVERGKWPVSTRGGLDPHWRGDGAELYYVGLDGAIMAVGVTADGDNLEVGTPQTLFTIADPIAPEPDFHFSVTRDGLRFLVSELAPESGAQGTPTPTRAINVIVNWSAGLPR